MYGPAVCPQEVFVDLVAVRSCINVFGLSSENQRACDLISGQASNGPFGSPVFACAGKTYPPSRLILTQTRRAGNGLWGSSLRAPCVCAVPLFVP